MSDLWQYGPGVQVFRQMSDGVAFDIYGDVDELILDALIGPRFGPPRPKNLRGPSLWARSKQTVSNWMARL